MNSTRIRDVGGLPTANQAPLRGLVSMFMASAVFMTTLAAGLAHVVGSDSQDGPMVDRPQSSTMDLLGGKEKIELTQLDPVKVGFVRNVALGDGNFYDVETIAVKPPIFAIPNFLADEECERIKDVARGRLRTSKTVVKRRSEESDDDPHYTDETFAGFDRDGDKLLGCTEALDALAPEDRLDDSLPENITTYIFENFLDNDSDGSVTLVEFRSIPSLLKQIKEWVEKYKRDGLKRGDVVKMRRGRARVSEQTWLKREEYDSDNAITGRAAKLSELDPHIHFASRLLQVARYTPGGHYHAHYDSSNDTTVPCHHTKYLSDGATKTRNCRFLTILHYLNDVEEGGETAFPIADNETYHSGSLHAAKKEDRIIDGYDLTHHCHDANIVVRPKKGLAVMWYNHHINEETGWVGRRHDFSLHGGCDVIKGEKWIANTWIQIDDDYDKQIKYMADEISKEDVSVGDAEAKKGRSPENDQKQVPAVETERIKGENEDEDHTEL